MNNDTKQKMPRRPRQFTSMEASESVPRVKQWPIKHYQQQSDWDCGLACVTMLLSQEKQDEFLANFAQVCSEEGFNKSTWSIDLCYLLKRFLVPHEYRTLTIGIDPGYSSEGFYSKKLQKDEERVNKRFSEASIYGIRVKKAAVEISDIVTHLAQHGPVILLTNANLLFCDTCVLNRISAELCRCVSFSVAYQGHYILLCGYDMRRKRIMYRNPAFRNRVCMMSFSTLDDARQSYGTDEDAIFIYQEIDAK